ncbi:uncharacterized protein FOMMEDRAFT_163988 [Fomitiporia mediterranea MF3/22]|uniref:Uncharacterized protein n=1 Tax=Fomitiporia mediterranea (strain MF3/22) TaxID=694068 RepID=R7SF35_FOMME|nr:uncharacterized protein FOMMEDRAFT_163988 [Fomitiporia mediterranea MF3/22]EJC97313.1 hypothetical protein FOMMEDRAFT_163988 [Fomitiporia mediterranea MF3/22]
MHLRTSSRSATQATIGEYALATMSMYDHSSGAILSLTPRALSFPAHHPMLDITLDGPTPCAFIFPSAPPLTSPELSLPAPPTSSSPFEPERPRDTPLKSSTTITEFTASPIARRVVARTCNALAQTRFPLQPKLARSTLRISDPGDPPTLAARCRSTASITTTCSTSIHTRSQFNLQGPSDDQYVVTKTTSNGLRMHSPFSNTNPTRRRMRQRQLVVQGLGL